MMDEEVRKRIVAQNRDMRAMTESDRRTAIERASNVIGHDRFCERARHVELRNSYRSFRPDGGKA